MTKFRIRNTYFMLACLLAACLTVATPAAADKSHSATYTDNGRGTPLVLIHAFPADKQLWSPQASTLAHRFRVITLDLAGFGSARQTDGQAVSMSAYAAQIKDLLDQLHIKKAIIGGESMGGYVALTFLKEYPGRVSGLILSNTRSVADDAETRQKREKTAQDVLANGPAKFIHDFLPKALSPAAPEQTREYLQGIFETQSAAGIASALRGMAAREDTSKVLSDTLLPVLIITSDQDVVISPQESRYMSGLARNSKLVMIENAGHLSSLEQPEEWNQAVINMFGG